MKLNIVEKALWYQRKGYVRFGHFILALFSIEIPNEVVFKQVGGG